MLFNSFIFFIFLGLVLPIFYLLPSKTGKNIFLVLCSYFFYGYWDWRFCILLLFSTTLDYFVGLGLHYTLDPKRRKLLLILSIIVNLTFLGFFKYFNFFASSFSALLSQFGLQADFLHLNVILPVGISFYTFQSMAYALDIYYKKITPCRNYLDYALFVSFFPQLVAGPISRASMLLPQLTRKMSPSRSQIETGIVLIVYGLFRKVLIGDMCGRFVDHIFGNLALYSSWEILAALILFSIQIYADFSGYSYIAQGTANLLGVNLVTNFEQPYLSTNITEFWRRWHISLSTWLRDYLYIPLGGNRKGTFRTYLNNFITMLLGGLWHGANWTFVIWGGLHGIYLAIHKFMLGGKKIYLENKVLNGVSDFSKIFIKILFTNFLVLFAWLFFRIENMQQLFLFFNKLFHWNWGHYPLRFLSILVGMLTMMLLFDIIEYKTKSHSFFLLIKNRALAVGMLTIMFMAVLIFLINSKPLPFIYFQF